MSRYKKTECNSRLVHEGWLTKSPPTRRVFRAKWRKRWFTLRVTKEGPVHYFLDYYTDESTSKHKGTIDLYSCNQIDSGLCMPRENIDDSDSRGRVFSIRTESRTYHLEANSPSEMEKWVQLLSTVCGMKQTKTENPQASKEQNTSRNLQMLEKPPFCNSSKHYIPISECITGLPGTNPENVCNNTEHDLNLFLKSSTRRSCFEGHDYPPYANHPQASLTRRIRRNKLPSAISKGLDVDDESVNPNSLIPPRPPKPLRYSIDATHKESFVGPRIREPTESILQEPELTAHMYMNASFTVNGDMFQPLHSPNDIANQGPSSGYCNIINTPPRINRELKPGRSHTNTMRSLREFPKVRSHRLEYLDLDLDVLSSSNVSVNKSQQSHSPTNYKKVDFLKTNALNKTRLDNEADKKRQENSHRE